MPERPLIDLVTRPTLSLPALQLALDPHRSQPFAFISHAHADHFARHDRILCSPVTGHLLHKRFRVAASRIEPLPYNEPLSVEGHTIRLLPAGHIFGSAMIHITRESDQASLLYTGDFKLRPSLTSEPTQLLPADTLIMETTFGLPHYRFPPQEEIERDILRFVRETLDDGEVPILLGYSLGKAQEALALLHQAGLPATAHKTVHEMSKACHEAGLPLPPPELLEQRVPTGHTLVAPPNAVRSKVIRSITNRRVAMLTGWALNSSARYRYQTDAAFPLSDHADYPDLVETVRTVQPTQVLTLHGSTREFARDLRREGFEAWSIYGDDQIELELKGEEERDHSSAPPSALRETEVALLTTLINSIASSSSRLKKVSLLAEHLQQLSPRELDLTTSFLAHRLLGKRQALSLGSALIRQSLLEATGAPLAQYRQISNRTADSARTARLLLEEHPSAPSTEFSTLEDLANLFQTLAETTATLPKSALLADAWRALSPPEAEFVVRLLMGDLRAGLKTALIEDAIAEAFSAEAPQVRRTHMLLGDLAATAQLAREEELATASLQAHSPLAPMLASPEPDAAAIAERFGNNTLYLEPKHDGIRAQLHYSKDGVSLYSRDLRSLNEEFPELIDAAKSLPCPCILDGELIAFAEGRKLTFFDLQKRLGRKRNQGDLFLGEAVPVRFIAFDILWKEGEDLLEVDYLARRKILEHLPLADPFQRIELFTAQTVDEIEHHFKNSLTLGHEGLIAKEPNSFYSPGRRGKAWLKLKGVMPTLDCVVVAAQQGHGKRAELLSNYTFALRDESSGELLTLGKAYSGLTDVEIEELTEYFKQTTVTKKRRVHQVEPTLVLEIAFDSVNLSKRHDSGLALRFPRIKSIRRDKSLADIDTIASARALLKK